MRKNKKPKSELRKVIDEVKYMTKMLNNEELTLPKVTLKQNKK